MFRLLGLLLLVACSARGQVSLPPPAGVSAPRFAAADTVAALHRLFADQRAKGRALLGGAGLVALLGAGGAHLAAEAADPGQQGYTFLAGAALGLVVAVPLALASSDKSAYTKRLEKQVVAGYEATHVLPLDVRRALRLAHFRFPEWQPPQPGNDAR
ncbi:hypothetical protein I2I05_21610 [Hymenobacter sp. BT683]|uniref:YtxH domain-containing protein n=1 Tax=Hymenobacter jeongseonensis TaxID=2791027 RepID=A0ABS0INP8_9BACT|nr:hypothetical protein [Hymenobacter jeongseonensis]MBF9240002.1 hypothetical protein [Hymenobacter jeongseonensis]